MTVHNYGVGAATTVIVTVFEVVELVVVSPGQVALNCHVPKKAAPTPMVSLNVPLFSVSFLWYSKRVELIA